MHKEQIGLMEDQRENAKHSRGGKANLLRNPNLGNTWQRATWQAWLGRTEGGKLTQAKGKGDKTHTRWRQSGQGGRMEQVCTRKGSPCRTGEEKSEDKIKQEVKTWWLEKVNIDLIQSLTSYPFTNLGNGFKWLIQWITHYMDFSESNKCLRNWSFSKIFNQ